MVVVEEARDEMMCRMALTHASHRFHIFEHSESPMSLAKNELMVVELIVFILQANFIIAAVYTEKEPSERARESGI